MLALMLIASWSGACGTRTINGDVQQWYWYYWMLRSLRVRTRLLIQKRTARYMYTLLQMKQVQYTARCTLFGGSLNPMHARSTPTNHTHDRRHCSR